MRLVVLVLVAGCAQGAPIGDRCANDAECAAGGLCESGRCGEAAKVEKARMAAVRESIEKARESVEAAGLRVDQAAEAIEADRTSPDAGGAGARTTGRLEKAGERIDVHREDYQRNAVGKTP